MATKLYDLAVVTRKYTDNAGQEKNVWENVGAILQADGDPYMMLKAHFLPAAIARKDGSESILVSMFVPKDAMNPDGYAGFNYDGTAGHRLYNLAVATRRWQTQTGEQRTSWLNVGAVIMGKEGRPYMMLKAHFNPAGIQRKEGSESILISLFKPKPKEDTVSDGFDAQDDFNPQPSEPDGPIPF
ncbi:MAG: hypothetical protein IJS28_06955 [Synergistaceae bacterium]|nr:hypothetical protein [Synergistaceae bacterium]